MIEGVEAVAFGSRLFLVLKFPAMPSNDLYLVVLPLIRLFPSAPQVRHLPDLAGLKGITRPDSVQQFLTLFPDRNFATEFYEDEVQYYIDAFKANIAPLSGGHVTGYQIFPERTDDGRVVVKVVQHVA
jgi:hypothetical protein